jgi:hypothetical protein
MKQLYAHDATVRMDQTDDPNAVGAAVTVALCGHWSHQPPCPLAPHHTGVEREAEKIRVRILFAAEPVQEGEVRRRIDQALANGALPAPHHGTARWQVLASRAGVVHDSERSHGERLIHS